MSQHRDKNGHKGANLFKRPAFGTNMPTSDRFASVSELPGVAVGRFMIEADLQRELEAVDPYANVTLTSFTGTAERILAMEVPMKDVEATLLMHACSINRSDLVRMLLIEGKSIEATNSKNKTALMIAAEYGSWACVKALLTAGANTAAHSDDGRTALHYGSGGNNVGFKSKVVNELLEAGADMHDLSFCNNTALHESCQDHLHTVSLLLIRKNANVNAVDCFQCTPLHLSIAVNEEESADNTSEGDAVITAILVACGADVTLLDEWGQTALHRARATEHTASRFMLLEFAPQLAAPYYDDLSDASSEESEMI